MGWPRFLRRERAARGAQKRHWRQGWLLSPTLAAIYLAGLPGWWLASLCFGDRWLWLFLLNSIAIYLFLPLPLVLIAAVGPAPGLRPGAALALLLFLGLYGQLLVSRPAPPSSGPALTVLTYNVQESNPDPAAVAEAVAGVAADVVALQELSSPIAAAVQARLGESHPYHLVAAERGRSGMGVWSRYPLRDTGRRLAGPWLRDPQILEVALPSATITLINVHNISLDIRSPGWWARLHHSAPAREAAARSLSAYARARSGPLVVLGDFNATDQSRFYRLLSAELRDAWREAGLGLGHTYPGTSPGGVGPPQIASLPLPRWLARIDYVLHSAELRATGAWIGPWDGGSDHRPVVARLALVAAPAGTE